MNRVLSPHGSEARGLKRDDDAPTLQVMDTNLYVWIDVEQTLEGSLESCCQGRHRVALTHWKIERFWPYLCENCIRISVKEKASCTGL